MKTIFIILFVLITKTYLAQDSSMAKPKFNYAEFNVNSANYYKPSYNNIQSFNSINVGLKIGHHKLTAGLLNCPVFVLHYLASIQYSIKTIVTDGSSLNFNANYCFYFSKKQKHFNPFIGLNFNTQKVKDYITQTTFENKTGYALGLGFGTTFYIKNRFIIEPTILTSAMQFKDKNIYTKTTFLTTTYTEEIGRAGELYYGISLKLGYIIPFKNK